MYIYHALINALGALMIHINLNMIFYTYVEHSPTKTIYIKYKKYKNLACTHACTHTRMHARARTHTRTHTHTHIDCSRNWVLILGWKYCEKRKVFSLSLAKMLELKQNIRYVNCSKLRLLSVIVLLFTRQTPLLKSPESECSCWSGV